MGWDKGDLYEMELLKAQRPPDEQVRAREAAKPLLIGPQPLMDDGFDDLGADKALCWGVQRDPGDET